MRPSPRRYRWDLRRPRQGALRHWASGQQGRTDGSLGCGRASRAPTSGASACSGGGRIPQACKLVRVSENAEARRSGPRTQPPKRLGGYAYIIREVRLFCKDCSRRRSTRTRCHVKLGISPSSPRIRLGSFDNCLTRAGFGALTRRGPALGRASELHLHL